MDLPAGGPVALVQADWGNSAATPRGGALLVELHASLQLRNVSPRRIRAVSLRVARSGNGPGRPRSCVTRPGLDVAPGESFTVRLDLRLMRPLAPQSGALVEVGLDGVLFEDLTFYGPNRMNVRRTMLAWELEARRDRQMLAALLESHGEEAVRTRLLEVLARSSAGAMMPVQVARGAVPATNVEPGRMVELAALRVPDSPVELLSGQAVLAGQEARTPRIELANHGRLPIRFVEIGWLVAGPGGRLMPAGTLPAEIHLPPGERSTVRPGQPGTVRPARGSAHRVSGAGGVRERRSLGAAGKRLATALAAGGAAGFRRDAPAGRALPPPRPGGGRPADPRDALRSEAMDFSRVIGRAPERLTLEERSRLAGRWLAFEVYTPQTQPLKRIEAVGQDVAACVEQLEKRGLDPRNFEFVLFQG